MKGRDLKAVPSAFTTLSDSIITDRFPLSDCAGRPLDKTKGVGDKGGYGTHYQLHDGDWANRWHDTEQRVSVDGMNRAIQLHAGHSTMLTAPASLPSAFGGTVSRTRSKADNSHCLTVPPFPAHEVRRAPNPGYDLGVCLNCTALLLAPPSRVVQVLGCRVPLFVCATPVQPGIKMLDS